MAPLLKDRHQKERTHSERKRRERDRDSTSTPSDQAPGGDARYRIPTIGLNAGAMPGTNPLNTVR